MYSLSAFVTFMQQYSLIVEGFIYVKLIFIPRGGDWMDGETQMVDIRRSVGESH